MIPDALRPFLAALLTLPLRSLAGWLAAKGYTEITGEQITHAVNALLVWILPALSTLAVVVRRLADKKINPDNAASTHAAAIGKAKQRARKETRKLEERLNAAGLKQRDTPVPPNSLDIPQGAEGERRWYHPPVDRGE